MVFAEDWRRGMREGDDEIGFYFFFSLFSLHSCPLLLDRGSGVEVELHIANLAIQCCFVL